RDAVKCRVEPRVARRIDGSAEGRRSAQTLAARRGQYLLLGIEIRIPLTVAICIEHKRSPALRLLLIVSLIPHLCVQPPYDPSASTRTGPKCVVRVTREDEVVSREAGI